MSKIRVLIVDDSSVIRRILTEVLVADPEIEVVGAAPSARIALERLQRLRPDVVTLDIEMPEVSGLELLPQIRKIAPKLPVIMFSSLTVRAAADTLEALALGASDYVTKPVGANGPEAALEKVRSELIPKIKTLAGSRRPKGALAVAQGSAKPLQRLATGTAPSRIDVLAIGASTGGPNALTALFRGLPRVLPVPVLIVQHMPPVFTQLLAERLTASCGQRFVEAKDGDEPCAGGIWIAPGDYHMRVARAGSRLLLRLDQEPPENSVRPAVDVLFRSVAETFGKNSLAVVLTGMGQDGLRGSTAISQAAGQVLVQDEESSVVWGMPGFVARAGLAERILPLAELAAEIARRTERAHAPSLVEGIGHVG